MTLLTFILWCVAIYLFIQIVIPLFLFLCASLFVGSAAIAAKLERRKDNKRRAEVAEALRKRR